MLILPYCFQWFLCFALAGRLCLIHSDTKYIPIMLGPVFVMPPSDTHSSITASTLSPLSPSPPLSPQSTILLIVLLTMGNSSSAHFVSCTQNMSGSSCFTYSSPPFCKPNNTAKLRRKTEVQNPKVVGPDH